MNPGIRAEIRVDAPDACPVARVAAATGADTEYVSKCVPPEDPETVVHEFLLDADLPVGDLAEMEVERVFTYGSKTVYRLAGNRGSGCPCERVEDHGCPLVDRFVRAGTVHLIFHAPDMDRVQAVLADLDERYGDVEVTRLVGSDDGTGERDLVIVDRARLTDRQRECLRTAHRMGYFQHPKRANAGEVAEALGVTTSTFTEHLAAAQTKLLDAILDP